jgi:serine/threonine protein kinase
VQKAASTPARKTLGSWELLAEIGRGAATIVYRARPKGCETSAGDYALKLLAPEFASDRLARSLLQREAHVAQQVTHPHLTTVLHSSLEGPPHYVVTPYYAGATLAQTVEVDERLPTPHALWIVRQAAEALAALHDAGWLHLDVSAGNVIVAATGHATLLDLGLARRLDEQRTTHDPLVGTPASMAPEMFQAGGALTPATDVYSLGVILYQLLVGSLPFADDDPMQLVAAHLETPPPALRQRLPHVPRRLARLVRRMLAKEPLRRPSVEELVATLADLEIETFAERLVA